MELGPGPLNAASLLVLEVLLASSIGAQTAGQLAAGVRFPRGRVAQAPTPAAA